MFFALIFILGLASSYAILCVVCETSRRIQLWTCISSFTLVEICLDGEET